LRSQKELRNIRFIIDSRNTGAGGRNAEAIREKPIITGPAGEESKKLSTILGSLVTDFISAMDEDFNSAGAIGVLFDAIKTVNTIIQDPSFAPGSLLIEDLAAFYGKITKIYAIFGIDLEKEIAAGPMEAQDEAGAGAMSAAEIGKLVSERNDARKNRDFAKSDEIRDRLLKSGIILDDRKEGTIWRYQK
jgi:cysteinyl-tRNA synthetase